MDKSMIINQIKDYYKFKSDAEFARFLGIKPQTLSSWYSRNTFDIDLMYAKCVEIDGNWLLSGKGPMLKSDMKIQELNNFKIPEKRIDHQSIPLYDIEATAGLRELFNFKTATEALDTISIPGMPRCDGAVPITGDSMYPLLKSGDIVLFAKSDIDNIFWGEMYLISIKMKDFDEFVTVKYIQKSEIDHHVKLVSQNSHHSPKDVHVKDIVAIALIKASIRFNTMM